MGLNIITKEEDDEKNDDEEDKLKKEEDKKEQKKEEDKKEKENIRTRLKNQGKAPGSLQPSLKNFRFGRSAI